MSEAFTSINIEGSASWRHKWSTGLTSPFELYQDGELIDRLNNVDPVEDATTTGHEAVILGSTSEPAIVELFDANTTGSPQQILNPPWLTIQWRGDTGNMFYRVENYEDSSSAWAVKHTMGETASGYYNWQTPSIADGTTASQWRVIAEDIEGNDSSVASMSVDHITNPGAPDITVTYTSADTTITVSAAT